MKINIYGLKCDNLKCNYRDDSVQFVDYQKHINSKCPKCDEVLLTQSDYDMCVNMYKMAARVEVIGNILKWINPFHYIRLLFGDKRKMNTITKKFK